jgi:hypothetical protein
MDNPAPPWPQHTLDLIDETEQFVTCEVLDYIERHNHVERSIRLRHQSRQKVAFFYTLDAEPLCGPNLLGRTVHPPDVDVSFPLCEVNEGAMPATQIKYRAATVYREMGMDKFD